MLFWFLMGAGTLGTLEIVFLWLVLWIGGRRMDPNCFADRDDWMD